MIFDALSFFASAVAAAVARWPSPGPGRTDHGPAWKSLVEGIAFIYHNATLAGVAVMGAVVAFFAAPVVVLLPVLAKTVLHQGPQGLGLLYGAAGFGAFLGAGILGLVKRIRWRGPLALAGAAVSGAGLMVVALTRHFWLVLVVLAGIGVMLGAASVLFQVFIQQLVPDDVRGRVFAALNTINTASQPVSLAAAGVLADRLSAPLVVFACGACIGLVSLAGLAISGIRDMD